VTSRPRAAFRRFRFRRSSGAIVLRYHRIWKTDSDPFAIAVRPEYFREHLQVLSDGFRPIRMRELASALRDGRLPERCVVVTFDDGYQDNLTEARPLLARFGIPATVFVVTGYVGGEREFWWDELAALLLSPGSLPAGLRLRVRGSTSEWDLDSASEWSRVHAERHSGWDWRQASDPTPRHRILRELFRMLRSLNEEERTDALDQLAKWAGRSPVVRDSHRTVSLADLASLSEDGLIEIGAHSATHPLLPRLPVSTRRDEIRESRVFLEERLDRPVESFAYPFGGGKGTATHVRDAGFTSASGTNPGVVLRGQDPFHLPRLYVGDWGGDELQRRMDRFI